MDNNAYIYDNVYIKKYFLLLPAMSEKWNTTS